MKHNDSKRRKQNYQHLKNAGFNSYEANRFKDYSAEKRRDLIELRMIHATQIKEIAGDKK